MPAITFQDFAGGLDLRRDKALSASNVLAVLNNAYINNGHAIKKRPCLTFVATLEAGTVGLRSAGGYLNTFYGGGTAITHANPLFRPLRVPHPTLGTAPTRIYFCENFNALPYVAAGYSNGDIKHHYLDDSTQTAWATATAYALNTVRRPTVANGLVYKVTAVAGSGTSGGAEPTWPLTIGATVVDNAGANQLTWTAQSNVVADANCPHTRQVKKIAMKIYARRAANVAFCATALPRDWTTANDAGFIPSGISAPGSEVLTALGNWNGDLGIFYEDSLQIWDVDADPANNVMTKSSENTGTIYADTAMSLAGDLVFLSQQGFRSASILTLTNNLQEIDMGSAIDTLRSDVADDDDPLSVYYPKLGQLWCINGHTVYVYALSKTAKISAWQVFTLPITVDAAAVRRNALYLRTGDDVYRVDDDNFADEHTDTPTPPLVEVEMFYQDAKTPDILKQMYGFSGLVTGSPDVSFKYQEKLDDGSVVELETQATTVSGDMRPGVMEPMEVCSVAVAPKFTHQLDEDLKITQLMVYYNNLGPV